MGGLIERERIGETRSEKFTGSDLRLQFSDGATFILPAAENLSAETGTVTIQQLEQERFFNTDQDLVFDLSEASGNYLMRFEYPLSSDLESEDISLYLYSPSTSIEEFDGREVNFTYDRGSGRLMAALPSLTGTTPVEHYPGSQFVLSAGMPSPSPGDGNYSRLVLSWQTREDLAENDLRKVIEMPFYEQSAETCWAACAKMMGRAYATVHDRDREIRIQNLVKYMGHRDFEAGLGIFAFRTYLPGYLNAQTGVKYEVSSFLRTSRLRSEIIRHLNNNRPVILNLSTRMW